MVVSMLVLLSSCSGKINNEMTTVDNSDVATETKVKANSTYTGYPPLPEVKLTVSDPDNAKGLKTQKIEHAYGVAKDGKPHQISVDSQKFFESKGYKAVTYDTKSDGKMLYLTFDCGYENGYTEKILDTLKEKKSVRLSFVPLMI